jgi:hypothetical protein
LDQAQRSKLSSDSQKAYITAFYRNRMSLSEQNPDAADSWISSQVSRLAHQQTGLTAQGTSVAGANEWAQMQSNKLLGAAMGGMGGSSSLAGLDGAINRLKAVLERPFVFEVRADTGTVLTELERRVGVQMRRGQ